MTMTPTRTQEASSLADDVRAIQALPGLDRRRSIRKKARLSLAQVGRAIGVSGQRVWQFEMRLVDLPVTENTARYARLIADLDKPNSGVQAQT